MEVETNEEEELVKKTENSEKSSKAKDILKNPELIIEPTEEDKKILPDPKDLGTKEQDDAELNAMEVTVKAPKPKKPVKEKILTAKYVQTPDSIIEYFIEHPDESIKSYLTDNPILLNIDVYWEGINFLVNGKKTFGKHPLGSLIKSRSSFKKGPNFAHLSYNTSGVVKEINSKMRGFDRNQLKENYDAAKMEKAGLYPEPLWKKTGTFDQLLEHFEKLVDFYRHCGRTNSGLIVYIN